MDFALSEDERALEDAARAFAVAELAPYSAKWDEESFFPVETLKKAAGLRLRRALREGGRGWLGAHPA